MRISDFTRFRPAALLAVAGSLAALSGCKATKNSFFDPSVTGRWEKTPGSAPILSRLAAIEEEQGDLVEFGEIVPGDLVAQPQAYRVAQGEQIRVTVWDLLVPNQAETYEREVDARGQIELPQLGRFTVANKTSDEILEQVRQAMTRFTANPLAAVEILSQRQSTYNIIGAVERPGPYFIPRANYRILEAITSGGRFDETIEEVYVIRQVPLTDESVSGFAAPPPDAPRPSQPDVNRLLNIIDDIAPPTPPADAPTPADPPADKPAERPVGQPGQPGLFGSAWRQPGSAQSGSAQSGSGKPADKAPPPAINLVESESSGSASDQPAAQQPGEPVAGRWIFVNGKWVQVMPSRIDPPGTPGLPDGDADLLTQRVIRVPVQDLLAGKQSVNIVVRPGDVIRVPTPPVGNIYIGGQVQRPGVFNLPTQGGGLTLTRALTAAGGLASIAIPENVDITRMTGKDRQATIKLDVGAIMRHEQPDIWLKPNDHVNVGTSFWALPLAVIRNGFRASYGFGFVLDRNISNDLLGPPPVNAFGQ